MDILLIGEYSRLHNSLKEGLEKLGHRVVICGFKDGFKDFPVDWPLYKKWDTGMRKKIKIGVFRLTGFDISSYLTYRQFSKYRHQVKGFDVVQLINENSFECQPNFEQKILKFIFENNRKTFLLSCGDDYSNVAYNFAHPEVKSVVQPFLMGKIRKNDFTNILKFRTREFKKLHDFIFANISGVIATDLDYHAPLVGNSKYIGLVPYPINTDKIAYEPIPVTSKASIFLGINTDNYFKKGSDYFEQALDVIRSRYPETEITVTHSIPYAEYIRIYRKAHIVLDQAFSIDQGYNALEAMARGKVVFTGAEAEFVSQYQIAEPVNINASANVDSIVAALSALIENPNHISDIGRRARQFIEKEHDYVTIAQKYLAAWA